MLNQKPPLTETQTTAEAANLEAVNYLGGVAASAELNGEKPEYQIFINPYERIDYINKTDDLITMLDGTNERGNGEPYDAVVFLDSSARPVSWMVREMWDFAADKQPDGQTVPKPKMLFADIDARRASKEITDEQTESLRNTYQLLQNWESDDPEAKPKRVLIVDEIAVSGDTLETAKGRFKAAFPGLEFGTYAWQNEMGTPDNRLDNVRWYEPGNDRMRLVLHNNDMHKRLTNAPEPGDQAKSPWLATPNPEATKAGLLRQEMIRMVDEVKSGELPYWPSKNRPTDDFLDRIEDVNHLNGRQFTEFLKWMRRYYAPSPAAKLQRKDAHGPLLEAEAIGYLGASGQERMIKERPKLDVATTEFAKKFGYLDRA